MAHFLVTGGAGYVGSHTLRCLARAGHDAVVLDDLSSGHRFLVGDAPLVQGDVCDPNAVSRVFEERGPFDAVLHFAALISVGESVKKMGLSCCWASMGTPVWRCEKASRIAISSSGEIGRSVVSSSFV